MFESLLKLGSDRLKNRFIGVLIIYWIIFNWKGLVYLFFSKEKIEVILDVLQTAKYCNIWVNFLNPFFFAFVSIAILPYLNMVIDMIIKSGEIKRRRILSEKKVEKLKGEVEEAKQEAFLSDIRTDYKTKEKLNETINNLRESIYDLEAKNQNLINTAKQQETLNTDAFQELDKKIELLNSDKLLLNSQVEKLVIEGSELRKSLANETKKNNTLTENLKRNKILLSLDNKKIDSNFFIGFFQLQINISINHLDKFKSQILARPEFSVLKIETHKNKIKIDYQTFIFMGVTEDFYNYLEGLLNRNEIGYIDLAIKEEPPF